MSSSNIPTTGDVDVHKVSSENLVKPLINKDPDPDRNEKDEKGDLAEKKDANLEERSLNKWNDFESQYLSAVEQSAVIEREQWGSQLEFLMSCIASAVGLGNIWRFPFIAGRNGGGAFIIPYFVVLTVIGRPLYMLEVGLGQFVSGGPVKVWEMAPAFRGVGFGTAIASFLVSTFYCVVMGWSLLYLCYSFYSPLPWNRDSWSPLFQEPVKLKGLEDRDRILKFYEKGHLGMPQHTGMYENEFHLGLGLDGPPVFNLAMSLLVAWILVWLVMIAGVSGSGKISFFTALFPYVVLIILIITGLTLEGAFDGLEYFFTPSWEKIVLPQTWFEAVGQCFFSLGITYGDTIMFASFNSFHHKLGRDILIISLMDTLASLLAGTFIFSLIGNLSKRTGQSISNISETGESGMAFITFPAILQVFEKAPGGAQVFSFLFFFMILVLAIGSANGLAGTCVTVICDTFPNLNRRIVVTVVCVISFLVGLIYVCPTGTHVIDIVDRHGSEMVVYVMAIFEVIGVICVYGLKNISNDFEFMFGSPINMYWIVCWGSLPTILFAIFISYMVTYTRKEGWPNSALYCGWLLSVICWSIIPLALIRVIQTRKSRVLKKRIKASFKPSRLWGPKDPVIRQAWRHWKLGRPTQFEITTKVLRMLHLSKSKEPLQSICEVPLPLDQTNVTQSDGPAISLSVQPETEIQREMDMGQK